MYDINLKNVKKQKGFNLVFILAGLLFLVIIGGVIVGTFVKESKMDASVMSSAVEIKESSDSDGTMYSPVYFYTVDGKEYECHSNSSSSSRPSEENKLVKYDSKNPSYCITEYDKSSSGIFAIFLLIPIIFIVVGVLNNIKTNKRIKQIKELNTNGKLVKGLPYRLENTGMKVNNVPIQRPVVDYVLPNGTTITLQGDARHDRKTVDADGLVDIIIDENNPKNYYIDFEINRLSGNLPSDYYSNTMGAVNTAIPEQQMPNQMYGQVSQQQMPNQMYGQVPQQQMPNQMYGQVPQQQMNNGQYPNQNNMQ